MSFSDEWPEVFVLDCGSSTFYAGIAGEDAPSCVFPSCIGTPKYSPIMISDCTMKSGYIGDQAIKREGILNLNYPIRNGIIKNWDLMEILLDYTFQEILSKNTQNSECEISDNESRSILFIDSILQPSSQKNHLMQLFFEKYGFGSFACSPQPLMSVYACGTTTALSLCLGEGVIQIVPCYWGFVDNNTTRRINFGGANVTDYMIKMLSENHGICLEGNRSIVDQMIRKIGRVAEDYDREYENSRMSSEGHQQYELPDGQVLNLSHEHFTCNEILFNPQIINSEYPGIVDIIQDSMQASNIDTRYGLYNNIIISGGVSLLPGLADRIRHDLAQLIPKSLRLSVVAAPERRYSSWIGGSIAGSLESFAEMAVAMADYEEYGCEALQRKKRFFDCFQP
ncbi:actin-related protein [Naegleria gruberi]|uniref:Actin-related protein n=1 Tax=Naegleria gruberi TaxID=5762 RepID=D2VB57_NAEGR|nr:actin-related protein [Naegleria gruberi]EFC45850.1 actin-related protein [Naegleria gruberi]|eukprot:XP_002678594.1 actin-related protein [Naegleria gruberi strain NEG-M]